MEAEVEGDIEREREANEWLWTRVGEIHHQQEEPEESIIHFLSIGNWHPPPYNKSQASQHPGGKASRNAIGLGKNYENNKT